MNLIFDLSSEQICNRRPGDGGKFVQVRAARGSSRGGSLHNAPIDCTTRAVHPNSASDIIGIVVTEISIVVSVILFLLVLVDSGVRSILHAVRNQALCFRPRDVLSSWTKREKSSFTCCCSWVSLDFSIA